MRKQSQPSHPQRNNAWFAVEEKRLERVVFLFLLNSFADKLKSRQKGGALAIITYDGVTLRDPKFSYFAYFDSNNGIARAVCPSLGLNVERSSIGEASRELLLLVGDWLRECGHNNRNPYRPIPADAWEENLQRFIAAVRANDSWDCGTAVFDY